MENSENKKKRFKLFDSQREGKGVSKNTKKLEPGLKRFFISYKNYVLRIFTCFFCLFLGNR